LLKTQPRTKHEVDRMTRCWVMAIWSFSHSDRTPDTRHRTRKWFYILSNAAMQCIGWLDRQWSQSLQTLYSCQESLTYYG